MKCWKCGSEILDDSTFCEQCGAKVTQEEPVEAVPEAPEQEQKVEEEQQSAPEQKQKAEEEQQSAPEQEQKVEEEQQSAPEQEQKAEEAKPNVKKGMKPVVVIGIVAIVLVIAIILLVSKLIGGSSNANDKQLVYIKGSSIYYTDNMDKDKDPIRICRVDGDGYWNELQLTTDGKYLYYYSETDGMGSGTLCRAELAKLSDNEDRNEKYIVEISSKVEGYTILEDSNVVVFRKENGKLLIFDGKDEIDIAKNTESYSVSLDQKLIFYTKYNDSTGETAYYYYNIAEDEEEKLTDAMYGYARWDVASDFIVYQSDEADEGTDLYVANASGENEKIDSEVYDVCDRDSESKSLYYLVERTENKNVYDYVSDPYAKEDADLVKPDIKDYLSEVTEQQAMSEYDYEYYCIDWPEDKRYFYEWLDYDSELELYYYEKYQEDDYGNSDWIDCYYSEVLNQWYMLDEEGYWDAYDKYAAAEDRIELREALQNEKIEITMYDLYFWKDGKEPVLIAEGVMRDSVWANAKNQLTIYEKESEVSINVSIDEIYSASDVSWQIEEAMWSSDTDRERVYYCTVGEKETSLDVEAEISGMDISPNGKSVVLEMYEAGERTLNQYSLTGKALEFETEIAEDALGGSWVDDVYYYYKDVDSQYYGSLYQYSNGKSEKIMSNVYTAVTLYDDGNYVAIKDQSYDESDIRVYRRNGDEIKLNSISNFMYISEDRIVYIKNDSLYVYRGKDEDRRIERNVEQFQCMGENGTIL